MQETNGLFERMFREAQDELASGKFGWKDAPVNTLIMACFGMLYNHLSRKLVKPMWLFSSSVFIAVVGYITHLCMAG